MRKYLDNGREVEVIQEINGIGCIIRDIYEEGEDSEENMSEAHLYKGKLFSAPPQFKFEETIQRSNQQIEQMNTDIKELIQKRNNIQKEIQDIEKNYKDRIDILKRHKGLERLELFLNDKITHFIIGYDSENEVAHSNTTILEKKDFLDEEYNGSGLRLLCLYGDSKGDLTWRINRYRDGSGYNENVIPCLSYEEAIEKLTVMIQNGINKINNGPLGVKKENYYYNSLLGCIRVANKYKIPVSQELVEICKEFRISEIDAYIEKKKAEIAVEEEKKRKCRIEEMV